MSSRDWDRAVARVGYMHGASVEVLEDSRCWSWLARLGTTGFTWRKTILVSRDHWGTLGGVLILAEEEAHLVQWHDLGTVGFLLVYLLLPLPVLISGRALLEHHGAKAQIVEAVRLGFDDHDVAKMIDSAARRMYGWRYLCPAPWAFWWVRAQLRAAAATAREEG